MVGGQDALAFDGRSHAHHPDGVDAVCLPAFAESLELVRLERKAQGWRSVVHSVDPPLSDNETIYRALVLGLRDYVEKNNFKGLVIGLYGRDLLFWS